MKFRILAQQGGVHRALCKVWFTRRDASVYLSPYCSTGEFFFGQSKIAERKATDTVDYRTQLSTAKPPHLSIHESGRVHARVGQETAGPLRIPALSTLRGQHLASVVVERFDAQPVYGSALRTSGAERDLVVPVEDGVRTGRFAIYANADGRQFATECGIVFTVRRKSIAGTLYLGMRAIAQDPAGFDGPKHGLTMVSGWDPTGKPGREMPYIYLRGQ